MNVTILFAAEDFWRALVWGAAFIYCIALMARNHIRREYRMAIVSVTVMCFTGLIEWVARGLIRSEGDPMFSRYMEDMALLFIVTIRTLAITWAVIDVGIVAWKWPRFSPMDRSDVQCHDRKTDHSDSSPNVSRR